MNGNVWLWCQDWYRPYPSEESVTDPQGATSGSARVVRGGSWFDPASFVRAASRIWFVPSSRVIDLGFRLVRTLP